MKKILYFMICCFSLVLAVDENYAKNRAGLGDDESVFETNKVIQTQEKNNLDDIQDNTYAVIYHHLQSYEKTLEQEGGVKQSSNFGGIHDFYADKLAKEQAVLAQQQIEQQKALEPRYVFTDGYCVLQNEVKIGRIAGYADLSCDLSLDSHATLKVALTPDFYSKALIATPLYINLDGNRYTITAGAVQNGIRTSINVASEVDDFLVSRIAAETAVGSASVMTQYAQEYIEERKDYRESKNNKKSTNQTVTDGVVIITEDDTSEDAPPKMGDYLGGALVEIVGKLIESAGNAYLQTREYSFKIDAKTVMFADLQFNINEQGIKGVGFEPQNLIVQQPSTNFSDNDPTQGINYPNANIGALPQTGTKIGNEQGSIRQIEQSAARARQNNSRIIRQPRNNGPRIYQNNGYNNGSVIDTRGNY